MDDQTLSLIKDVVGADCEKCKVHIALDTKKPLSVTLTSEAPCVIRSGEALTKLHWWLEDQLKAALVPSAVFGLNCIRELIRTELIPVAGNQATENFLWDCVKRANILLLERDRAVAAPSKPDKVIADLGTPSALERFESSVGRAC